MWKLELMRCVAVYPLPPRELLDQLQKMDVDIPDNYDLAAHVCELDSMPSTLIGEGLEPDQQAEEKRG